MDSFSSHYNIEASFIGGLANDFVERNEGITFIPVHSVFHRVINLNTGSELLSIVTSDIGRASTYIVISKDGIDFLLLGIKQGMNCKFCRDKVSLENKITVDIEKAKPWREMVDGNTSWRLSEVSRDNLGAFKSALDRYAAQGSAWRRIYNYKETVLKDIVKSLNYNNSPEVILGCVDKLLGFGPGLTPTGDDMLLGFLSIVNTCQEFEHIRNKFKSKILSRLSRTTDISKSILQQAVNNRYHEYIQEVLYSVLEGSPENILISVKRLLKVGATSGTDIATGVYFGVYNSLMLSASL